MKKLFLLLICIPALLMAACSQTPPLAVSKSPHEETTISDPTYTVPSPAPYTAPDHSGFDTSQYPIAMAMPAITHPIHRIIQHGFLDAAEQLGYNASIIGTEDTDQAKVYKECVKAAESGVKGIVLWAGEEDCFPIIEKLEKMGVAVIIPHFIFDPMPAGLIANLACLPDVYGAAVADYIHATTARQKGSVIISSYSENLTESAAAMAFKERMYELNPAFTIIGPIYEGDDHFSAILSFVDIIKEQQPIAIFGTSGNSAYIWAEAIAQADKPANSIVIVGMDYTPGNLMLLDNGHISALVAQPIYEEAYIAAHMLDKYFRTDEKPGWTQLDAPLIHNGGVGTSDPAMYIEVISQAGKRFVEVLH
ncbi:MAG: substrate-binding domain-containing protein [Christensenellales bacterium]|jgi:ribose transport system substrate-binding protein